jgi:hypothetical protein
MTPPLRFLLALVILFSVEALKLSHLSTVYEKHINQLRRPVISALIGFSLLQSAPAHAERMNSLQNIERASEAVDYILDNLDKKDTDVKKLFDEVDFIIKRFNLRERLQLVLAESPSEYR